MRLKIQTLSTIKLANFDCSDIEIGCSNSGLTLRFGYWKKLSDSDVEKVNEILGIDKPEPNKEIVKQEFKPAVPRKEDDKKEDVDNDYKYSRENYYNLIERGQEAIEGILDIAREGQHPRAYEVAGQLIGQVAGTVDKLQDLQKKLKDLKELPKTANANIKKRHCS